MKIKCNDGIIREFSVSDNIYPYSESCCNECGYPFGVHSTKISKPRWREHICKDKCPNCNRNRDEMKHIVFDGQYNCKNCGRYLGQVRETILTVATLR